MNVNNPRKLSLTSGFLLLHIYTNVELSVVPKNAWLNSGAIVRRVIEAYARSQEKCAIEAADSSSMRAYRWMKKMWKRRFRERGPK